MPSPATPGYMAVTRPLKFARVLRALTGPVQGANESPPTMWGAAWRKLGTPLWIPCKVGDALGAADLARGLELSGSCLDVQVAETEDEATLARSRSPTPVTGTESLWCWTITMVGGSVEFNQLAGPESIPTPTYDYNELVLV